MRQVIMRSAAVIALAVFVVALEGAGAKPGPKSIPAAATPATKQATTLPAEPSRPSVRYIDAHKDAAWALAVTPDGKTLASGGDDGKIIFWSLPEMKPLKTVEVGGLVRCLSFSSDGSRLYSRGGPGFDIAEVDTADYSLRTFRVEAMGSVLLVAPFAKDRKLVTVTASNVVLIHDLQDVAEKGHSRFLEKRKVFGGFIRHTALSPDRRFLAVSSQNKVANRSAEPRKLTVFDLDGQAQIDYTFSSNREYNSSSFAFSSDSRSLLLYAPKKPLRVFTFDRKKGQWSVSSVEMKVPRSRSYAACVGGDAVMYVGSFDRLGFFDRRWKKFRELVRLSIRASKGYPSDGIQNLLWVQRPGLIAALHDGRLAVIDVTTRGKVPASQSTTTLPARVEQAE